MSKVKVVRAFDPYNNNNVAFSVVASKEDVKFVFPKGREIFDGEQRVKFLLDALPSKPKSVDEWLDLGLSNLDSFMFKLVEDDGVDNLEDAVSNEIYILKELIDGETPKNASNNYLEGVYKAVEKLSRSDEEIYEYIQDPSVGLSLEKRKLLMATMIIAADTVQQNPWLMPWLNGEELDPSVVDSTLVLVKSDINRLDSDTLVNYEGDNE